MRGSAKIQVGDFLEENKCCLVGRGSSAGCLDSIRLEEFEGEVVVCLVVDLDDDVLLGDQAGNCHCHCHCHCHCLCPEPLSLYTPGESGWLGRRRSPQAQLHTHRSQLARTENNF